MGIRITMDIKTWAILLLLLGLSWAQNKQYFEWTPMKIERQQPRQQPRQISSLLPYKDDSSTSSYDSRYYDDNSAPYLGTTGYYPDSSIPYMNDGPYPADSYSADFPKSQQYQYPDDSSSYENYGYPRDEFNVTIEKYGGFGGTGDTRGYGAYDYPKKVQEVPQDLHHDTKIGTIGTDFPDLLRLGRNKVYRRRNPMLIHPLPPPL